jgi:hypothetical protein
MERTLWPWLDEVVRDANLPATIKADGRRYLIKGFATLRASELFDLIVGYPEETQSAVQDLKLALDETGDLTSVSRALSQASYSLSDLKDSVSVLKSSLSLSLNAGNCHTLAAPWSKHKRHHPHVHALD